MSTGLSLLQPQAVGDVALAVRFFVQVATILAACRAFGWLGERFLGQTQVVMEMVAGVALGPSLAGMLAPEAQQWLFPKTLLVGEQTVRHPSMGILYVTSQVGLVLYMFLVGMEFDLRLLGQRVRGALAVSAAGIAVPFLLGASASLLLPDNGAFLGSGVSRAEGALYLGAAMCITAFPMLARMIRERGLAGTGLGTLALAAGAFDDATAWAVLAIVLASFKGEAEIALFAIGGGGLFVLSMLTLGRRLLLGLERWTVREGQMTPAISTAVLCLLMLAAFLTDAIGIYAVFGAFVFGMAMPRGVLSMQLEAGLTHVTGSLLLPIFFVYSGLNTQIGLLGAADKLGLTALLVLLAIAGKLGGCAIAARLSGEDWRTSLSVGLLMNARGLMELIILNIGLQQGVITPTLYTILVVMAIVTTLMASPLFAFLHRGRPAVQAPLIG